MAAVTVYSDFGAQENEVCHCVHCFPISCHEVMGPDAMIFVFWMLSLKPAFSRSSFTFIKRLFSSSSFLLLGSYHLHVWGCWYFSRHCWFQLVIKPALHSACKWASQVALVVKTPFASEGDLRDLGLIPGWADLLEKGMASHSSILPWRITDRGAWRATVLRVMKESDTTEVT